MRFSRGGGAVVEVATEAKGAVTVTVRPEQVRIVAAQEAGEAAVFRMAPGNYAANAAVAGSRLVLTITEG